MRCKNCGLEITLTDIGWVHLIYKDRPGYTFCSNAASNSDHFSLNDVAEPDLSTQLFNELIDEFYANN